MRILLYFVGFLCCYISFSQTVFPVAEIDSTLLENANAVVRLDAMEINVLAVDEIAYEIRQVITVLNEKADYFSTVRIPFDKERKIKDPEIYIYNQLGTEIAHIKKKEFLDLSASDGLSLYTDDRLLYHDYTPITYPYTIGISYSVESSDTAFFPPWYFLPNYLVSVEKSSYGIHYGNTVLKPEVKEFRLDGFSINKTEEPGFIGYNGENFPAIKGEYMGPSFRDLAPKLSLRMKSFSLKGVEAHTSTWKDMGVWIEEALLKGTEDLPLETIATVRNLVEGVTDDLEKAKIIYKYVQDNTRYVSVQIGIGGWKPISALEVDEVKYGDCKGLSNYTRALLHAVNVPSYYTVIYAGKNKVDFDQDFASLQGNHAILAIPYGGAYYWIDCTSQIHPFGFVGDFTDDRLALVVTPEGGEIVRTVSYLNESNYKKCSATYALDDRGTLSADLTLRTGGVSYDNHFFLKDYKKKDIVKYYKDYWNNINNLELGHYGFNNNRDIVEFKEELELSAENYATKSGDLMLFVVNAFDRRNDVPKRYRKRKMPFRIQRGYLDETEYTIELPSGYALESMPKGGMLENEFGSYSVDFKFDETNQAVLYKRKLLVKQGNYPKEKYDEYRNFKKQIARQDNAKIVLKKI